MPCFDRLSERLLRAGIAPRHIRRYTRELSDHFDDLVREEIQDGASRALAETKALSRLGSEDTLAAAMLEKPELRSFMARFPWAVFGLGPVAMLAASIFAALYLEVWLLDHSGWLFRDLLGMTPGPVAARLATKIYTGYNTLIVYGGPLLFAGLFYWMGTRQRVRPVWIATGVVMICVLGGFQNMIYYDTGCRRCGVLLLQSGLLTPFWHFTKDGLFVPFHFAEGLARAAMNLAIAGGFWWLAIRRKEASAMMLSRTAT